MKACTEELNSVAGGLKAEPINLREMQYLLLLCKLESLVASSRQRSQKQSGVDGHLDRLEDERALVSAIDLYASLKDSEQDGGGSQDSLARLVIP